MLDIPQCIHCKNGKIKDGNLICEKYTIVPEKIANGTDICIYHKELNENK